MYNPDGPELARDFYGYFLGEGKGDYRMSAVALHEATKKIRDRGVERKLRVVCLPTFTSNFTYLQIGVYIPSTSDTSRK